MLDLSGIRKVYGTGETAHEAVRGVSVSIDRGDFVALMGPSGCGKSTLLHIAGAMDRPTEGTATLDGVVLNKLSDRELASIRRQQVGFVFQAFNLLPTLSALENVALPLLLDGIGSRQANDKASAALEQVGLSSKAKSAPSQLSGGEMQRVAIARAIAIEPSLLIADEPTGSLDSENGQRVLEQLTELNRSLGLTILMATHADEAADYASYRITMRDGLLESNTRADALAATV